MDSKTDFTVAQVADFAVLSALLVRIPENKRDFAINNLTYYARGFAAGAQATEQQPEMTASVCGA